MKRYSCTCTCTSRSSLRQRQSLLSSKDDFDKEIVDIADSKDTTVTNKTASLACQYYEEWDEFYNDNQYQIENDNKFVSNIDNVLYRSKNIVDPTEGNNHSCTNSDDKNYSDNNNNNNNNTIQQQQQQQQHQQQHSSVPTNQRNHWELSIEPELKRILYPVLKRRRENKEEQDELLSSSLSVSQSLDILETLQILYHGGVYDSIIFSVAIVLCNLLSTTTTTSYNNSVHDDKVDAPATVKNTENLNVNESSESSTNKTTTTTTTTTNATDEVYISSIQQIGQFLMIGSCHHHPDQLNHHGSTTDPVSLVQSCTTSRDNWKQKLLTLYGILAITATNPMFTTIIPVTGDINNDIPVQLVQLLEPVLNFCISTSTVPTVQSCTCISNYDDLYNNDVATRNSMLPKQNESTTIKSSDCFLPPPPSHQQNIQNHSQNSHPTTSNEKVLFVLWEIRSVCRYYTMLHNKPMYMVQEYDSHPAQSSIPTDTTNSNNNNSSSISSSSSSAVQCLVLKTNDNIVNATTTTQTRKASEYDKVNNNNNYTTNNLSCPSSTDIVTTTTSWQQPEMSNDSSNMQIILTKFRELYSIVDFQVLVCIAYIARVLRATSSYNNNNNNKHWNEYNESLLTVAEFLHDRKHSIRTKLSCLQIFVIASINNNNRSVDATSTAATVVTSVNENCNNNNTTSTNNHIMNNIPFDMLKDLLTFCTNKRRRRRDDDDDNHYYQVNWEQHLHGNDHLLPLLWEIRAICMNIRLQQRLERRRKSTSFFVPGVVACSKAAEFVTSGTVTIERSINTTTNLITSTIDAAGDYIVRSTNPSSIAFLDTECTITQLALSCTSSARNASVQTRAVTASAISGIKDVSRTSIRAVANKMNLNGKNDKEKGTQIISLCDDDDNDIDDDDNDDDDVQSSIVSSAGELGLVTIGAMVIVGDAISDSATKVIQHTSHMAADIVAHKYGSSAGQVVRDVADTTGNVLNTMKHVAFLVAPMFGHGQGVARMVVKDTSKSHINDTLYVESVSSSLSPDEVDKPVCNVSTNFLQSGLKTLTTHILPHCESVSESLKPLFVNNNDKASSVKGALANERHHLYNKHLVSKSSCNESQLHQPSVQKYISDSTNDHHIILKRHYETSPVNDDETVTDSMVEDDPEFILEVKSIGCL